jgi:hypothetical protein
MPPACAAVAALHVPRGGPRCHCLGRPVRAVLPLPKGFHGVFVGCRCFARAPVAAMAAHWCFIQDVVPALSSHTFRTNSMLLLIELQQWHDNLVLPPSSIILALLLCSLPVLGVPLVQAPTVLNLRMQGALQWLQSMALDCRRAPCIMPAHHPQASHAGVPHLPCCSPCCCCCCPFGSYSAPGLPVAAAAAAAGGAVVAAEHGTGAPGGRWAQATAHPTDSARWSGASGRARRRGWCR